VLAAALQSVNAYGAVAMVRGVGAPLVLCAFLLCAWLLQLQVSAVLTGLVLVSAAALVATLVVYVQHFELRRTFSSVLSPRRARQVLAFGLPLVIPNALWVVGGKIDLYLLRPHVGPAVLGVYGACLQLVSILPNVRTVFDPIVQAQIASLPGSSSRLVLGDSLQRLSRLCALVLLPVFVALVTLGEPTLGFLLGRAAPNTAATLMVLSLGQFLGSVAVGSWLTPMLVTGRALPLLAATTLVCKTALLLALAPRIGLLGAAIATAFGTVLAQQGMAVIGSCTLHVPVFSRAALWVGLGTLAAGVLSATALHSIVGTTPAPLAYAFGALVAGVLSLSMLFVLLDGGERARVRGWIRSLGAGS
jgi:O-antigen/teichoic acid export membrane protein